MKNIGINVNTNKDSDGKILHLIIKTIKSENKSINIRIFRDSIGLDNDSSSELDAVIVLGGDGTILSTSKFLAKYGVPILGINIGNLGFLAEVESIDCSFAINSLFSNNYYIEERKMIQCLVRKEENDKIFSALNDIVVSKAFIGRIAKYSVYINDAYYTTFVSDGVIAATPTGSTGYSLSAGGPIIYPTLNLISITPICSHSMGTKSIILDGNSKINIKIQSDFGKVHLAVDGQEPLKMEDINDIEISESPYKCKLIKLKNDDYFSLLRKKLHL